MARADLALNLRDPLVHLRRTGEALVTGVGTTVIAPARIAPWQRRSLHALSGVIGGGAAAWVVGQQDARASRTVPAAAAGATLLVGASVLGSALDGTAERWLAGRGVKRPRVVMGVVAGLFSLATLWAEDLRDEPDAADTPED